MSVDELRALLRDGADPVILDVRSLDGAALDPRRIPGAVPVDLRELDALAATLPRDREIVVYCACPTEASAARAAVTLARLGVPRARPLAGGLDAWFDTVTVETVAAAAHVAR